jgi:integrase
MTDESILIREDGSNRVRLYRRPDTPNFYFDIFVERKRVQRGSTGTDDIDTARRNAIDAYEDVLSKHRRGVPYRSAALKALINLHLADRDQEVAQGEVSAATVEQARVVLTQYFLPWCETAGIDTLLDVSDQRLREYVAWRRSYRPDGDTITYVRNGKRVTAKRPANHLRGLTAKSLIKQLDPIRRFFRWSSDYGHLGDRAQPRLPSIRTRSNRRPSPSGDDVPGRWFLPEQAVDLIKTAASEARVAQEKYLTAWQTYGTGYRERFQLPDGSRRISTRAIHAELFFYWLVLMLAAGTRPIELRNLCWKDVRPYRFATGMLGVAFNVIGKNRRREIVLDRDFLEIFYRIAGLINDKPSTFISPDDLPEDPQLSSDEHMIAEAIMFYDITKNIKKKRQAVFPIDNFRNRFYSLMKRANVYEKGHSPYSLRHTHINFRILQGDLPYEVSVRVGNSVKMIEQHYNALTPLLFGEREHSERIGKSIGKTTREFDEIILKQAIKEVQTPIREMNSMIPSQYEVGNVSLKLLPIGNSSNE